MIHILLIRFLFILCLWITLSSTTVLNAQDQEMSMSGHKEMNMSGATHSMADHTANSFEPKDVEGWVVEKTGDYIPLDTEFVGEDGKKVTLGDIIDRPTIILPIYFYCPSICSKNLANLATALTGLSFQPGKDYKAIALSFNDVENFEVARHAKANYLKIVGDSFPPSEWRFLTGTKDNIKSVTDSLGFRFQKTNDTTFIHPSALMIVSGEGLIIRYVYGSFLAGDIDMALLDAKSGTPSLSVKRLLAFCFNYDPDANKSVFQTIKVAVLGLFAVGLGLVFFIFRKKGRRKGYDSEESSNEQDK